MWYYCARQDESHSPIAWRLTGTALGWVCGTLVRYVVFTDTSIIRGYRAIVKPVTAFLRMASVDCLILDETEAFSMRNGTKKRVMTDEQRARHAEYLRHYRIEHPEAVRRWRERYIVRAADRLRAESAGGVDCGGD